MKPRLKLTPSRVTTYQVCPYKFGSIYLPGYMGNRRLPGVPGVAEGAASPGVEASASLVNVVPSPQKDSGDSIWRSSLALGSSLHAALDALHRSPPSPPIALPPYSTNGHDPMGVNSDNVHGYCDPGSLTDEEISSLLSTHWASAGFDDLQSEEAAFHEGCRILQFYCRSEHVPKGRVLATEAYLACVTSLGDYQVELSCRADRIELHDDGTLEVLDYKLSRYRDLPSPKVLSEDLASFLYFLLAWHHYRADVRVKNVRISQLSLFNLTKVEAEYNQHQIISHKEALVALVETVMEGNLEPRTNGGCEWCPVLPVCPAWTRLDMADLDSFTDRTES